MCEDTEENFSCLPFSSGLRVYIAMASRCVSPAFKACAIAGSCFIEDGVSRIADEQRMSSYGQKW